MSNTKHTPGLWRVASALTPKGTVATDIFNSSGVIAQFNGEQGKADARRIVLCVNACRELSNEHLEDDAVVKLKQDRDQLQEQNKELKQALSELMCISGTDLDTVRKSAAIVAAGFRVGDLTKAQANRFFRLARIINGEKGFKP